MSDRASRRNQPQTPRPAATTVPLIERSGELALLRASWEAARAGSGSAWLVTAEPGGGKSRLLRALVELTRSPAYLGAAEPAATPLPFEAITQALPGFVPAESRAQSVTSALALAAALAARQPALLILEDLHWADEGTIAIAVRLAARTERQRLLVVLSARPTDAEPGLLDPLWELTAAGRLHHLELPPLTPAGVGEMLAVLGGGSIEPGRVDAVYAAGGGNPWISEALALGGERLSTAAIALRARLQRLDRRVPGVAALCRALAPHGGEFPVAALPQLLEHKVDTDEPLHAAVEAGVLRIEGEGCAFRHELTRDAVLSTMTSIEQRSAHARLGALLAVLPNPVTATVGGHLAAAGDAAAGRWLLRAAREAAGVEAHRQSLAWAQQALPFLIEEFERVEAFVLAANAAALVSNAGEAARIARDALDCAGLTPEQAARFHQLLAAAAYVGGDNAADRAHLAMAEQLLAGRPPSVQSLNLAMARMTRAAAAFDTRRLEREIAGAMELAEHLGDGPRQRTARVHALRLRGVALVHQGDDRGLDDVEEALRLAGQWQLDEDVVANLLTSAYQDVVAGALLGAAEQLWPRFVAVTEPRGLTWLRRTLPHRALELLQRGRAKEASTTLPDSDEGLGPTAKAIAALVRLQHALRYGTTGEGQRAATALLTASSGGTGLASPEAELFFDLARLEALEACGRPERGQAAQRLYGLAHRRRYARIAGAAAVAMARAGIEPPQPPGWLDPHSLLGCFWQWARAAYADDRGALRETATRLDALRLPYEAGQVLRASGDLRAAYQRFGELDAHTARDETLSLMRLSGVALPRRRGAPEPVAGLTETERRITALVAAGASNTAIANELVISVRTVETHLTNIYRKIGQRGRAALATWAANVSQQGSATPSERNE